MDQRTNYLSLILLDALEDENEGDIYFILDRNSNAIDAGYVPQDRGIAPIHYACGMSNEKLALEITKRFLEMGADPNCKSDDNMTPLHVASMYGKVDIVRLLLQHGALLDVYDEERKTPVLYAIEECHFEVVQVMKDHIFLNKYEKKKQLTTILSESKFDNSLHSKSVNKQSTPQRAATTDKEINRNTHCVNKNLLKVASVDDSFTNNGLDGSLTDAGKFTPNRINYNYDVTSPYYINITHRRHKLQPKFPEIPYQQEQAQTAEEEKYASSETKSTEVDDILSISMQKSRISSPEPEESEEVVNIFSLTQENLKELTQRTTPSERSRLSLIQTWRDKVQKSRARQSILKHFDDINEMIDQVVENDHLNFSNTQLVEKSTQKQNDIEIDSGACDSTASSLNEMTQYLQLPVPVKTSNKTIEKSPPKSQVSLGNVIQTVAEAKVEEPVQEIIDLDSSYQTVPEITVISPDDKNVEANTSTNFIRSPKNNEYFLQMAEAYVHTDDENGLVFYETKLLSNVGNKVAKRRMPETPKRYDMDTSVTTQSTNVTIPLDYETDTLRAELTVFGEAPGPITKTTKRLYLKRLMKYKRKTAVMQSLQTKQKEKELKFSVELQRTIKTEENFLRIQDFMKFETQSMQFFINNQDKKLMREGHLKQSFIYMLIDPRISCNLPGESTFLEKFDVWQRFLQSIFYVGKGKTSRPYSHLYEAMKTHSRLHNKELQEKSSKTGKKISIKKQPLNIDIFKSPPQKSTDSKKLDRILNIWGNGYGVVCLHVFHNIAPIEAYTREAAIIDALSTQHLTNCKRGDYYGPAKTWTMKEKKFLGIALLFKAMHIYLAEGESQLSPSDLI